MARKRIDSIVDKSAIEKELVFLSGNLDELSAKIKSFPAIKVKQDGASNIKELSKAQQQYNESLKAVEQLVKARFASEAKLVTLQTDYNKQTIANRLEIQKTNQELKARAAIDKAAENSLEKVRALRAKIRLEVDKTNLNDGERLKVLNDRINKLTAIEKKFSDQQRQQSLNVGNYQGSAKIIVDAFERVRLKVDQVNRSFGPTSPEAKAARAEFEALDRITANPQFLNISAKIGDANSELKFFTKALIDLERNGQGSTDFAEELRRKLAALTDEISDTKQEIKALSSDSRSFDLFAGSVSFAADTFQTFAGAAQLAGASEEDVAEQIRTLTAVQAVANGVKGIANELTTKGTAANKAYAFVQTQVRILTDASATATQKWSAALKTIGVGLLIAGVVTLVDKLGLFGGASREAKEETERLTQAIERQKKTIDGINASYDFNISLLKNKLKQEGRSEAEITARIIEEKKRQLDEARDLEDAAKNERLKAEQDYQAKIAEIKKKFGDNVTITLDKEEQDQLKEQTRLLNEKVVQATENRTKLENEIILMGEEEKTRIAEDGFDKRKAAAEKASEQNKKLSEEEAKAALELLKLRQGLVIEQNNAVADDDLGAAYQARIRAAQQAAAAERIIIRAQKNFELDQENLTASQKLLIRETAQKDILDVEKRLAEKITQIRIDEFIRQRQGVDDGNTFYEEIASRNQKALEKELSQAEIFRDQELQSLNESFQAGTTALEKYNERKLQIEFQYQAKALQSQIEFYQKQLELSNLSPEEKLKAEAALAKAQVDLSNLVTDNKIKNDEKEKKSQEEKIKSFQDDLEKVKTLYQQFAETVGGIIDAIATAQLNNVQSQLDAIDKLKAAEIDRISQSQLSEEKKAARIKIIEAKAQSDREALERKQRQIKRQQAIFDKANNIANIILNTAEAVTKWLAKGNIALSIASGVIGAAQLAVAIATPIPQFAKGKKAGEYEGPGIVGEKGREMGIDEKGRITIYERPTLTYLSKGTAILPNQLTEDILNANNMAATAAFKSLNNPVQENALNTHLIEKYEEQIRLLKRIEQKEMKVVNNIYNDAAWNAYIEQHVKK